MNTDFKLDPPQASAVQPHLHTQFRQSLGKQVDNIEQEARMVLPGIQALLGFQLIAVFNQGFKQSLSHDEQVLHLLALLLVTVSTVLVMAPAAYHRQAAHQISKHFIELSSNFLATAMMPLALGTCIDIFLIARVILDSVPLSASIALAIFIFYTGVWFVFPRIRAAKVKNLPVHELPPPPASESGKG